MFVINQEQAALEERPTIEKFSNNIFQKPFATHKKLALNFENFASTHTRFAENCSSEKWVERLFFISSDQQTTFIANTWYDGVISKLHILLSSAFGVPLNDCKRVWGTNFELHF